ncbi:MAG: Brp/Blh family beta-carotene 15,15'-dioxygenase [Chitinophagaceae bacterium]|nr:Brp/Blh family beta-carotene 15,15'-dioxygenase [Chitinophagaceae bacterium]
MEAHSFHQYSGNPVLSKIVLASGLLLVLWNHFVIPVPITIQWIVFAVTILIAGIPHGALDHTVAKQNSTLQNRSFSSIRFYFTYLSRMLLYGICWYFFPSFALLLFIVLSAFHFGETDLPLPFSVTKKSTILLQTNYGLLIVLVLLLTHSSEVLPILSIIEKQNAAFLSTLFKTENSVYLIFSVLCLLIVQFFRLQTKYTLAIEWHLNTLLRTIIILGIIIYLPLPLAFAFYFGGWHSLQSLENIRQHLSNSGTEIMTYPRLLQKCIPYSLIAFVGIGILMILASYLKTESVFLFFFFIGIAILTAPHLEVMSDMYQHLRKKDRIST